MILEECNVRLCSPDSNLLLYVQGIGKQQRPEEHSNAQRLSLHTYFTLTPYSFSQVFT